MLITSRNNPLIKRVLSLRDKKYRREFGAYVIEGVKQVREAVACGCVIEQIICSESYTGDVFVPEKTCVVSDGVFEKLSEECSPQGILAVLSIPECKVSAPQNNSLMLDGIADPGNLGTIIRTANAAGYTDIYLRNCADPFSSKTVRAAMSGIFFVRLQIGNLDEIMHALAGITKICADMNGVDIFSYTAPEKFCLIIGNEANGVSREVREMCNVTVKIPMRESCESLNAAVSAGILMYELTTNRIL